VEYKRTTNETNITVRIRPGTDSEINTGIPFFDHMLNSFSVHGDLGLFLLAEGDLKVDFHHTIEDCGILVGDAIKGLIADGRGIERFGEAIIPMDEALATIAVDCGGRGYLVWHARFSNSKVGEIETDLIEHFFFSLATHAGITINIDAYGRNDHHICEVIFKAFGRALKSSLKRKENNTVMSTKGVF